MQQFTGCFPNHNWFYHPWPPFPERLAASTINEDQVKSTNHLLKTLNFFSKAYMQQFIRFFPQCDWFCHPWPPFIYTRAVL